MQGGKERPRVTRPDLSPAVQSEGGKEGGPGPSSLLPILSSVPCSFLSLQKGALWSLLCDRPPPISNPSASSGAFGTGLRDPLHPLATSLCVSGSWSRLDWLRPSLLRLFLLVICESPLALGTSNPLEPCSFTQLR